MSNPKKKSGKHAAKKPAPKAAAKPAVPKTDARYATLLSQGFQRHQILSCWLEQLQSESDDSVSMDALLTALFSMV